MRGRPAELCIGDVPDPLEDPHRPIHILDELRKSSTLSIGGSEPS
jgi:hypothetical protein